MFIRFTQSCRCEERSPRVQGVGGDSTDENSAGLFFNPDLSRIVLVQEQKSLTKRQQFSLQSPKRVKTETPRLDFFHVTDAQGAGEGLTCIAVSSSGDGIALGSASGACIQMGEGGRDIRSNLSSRPIEGPERPAPPPEVSSAWVSSPPRRPFCPQPGRQKKASDTNKCHRSINLLHMAREESRNRLILLLESCRLVHRALSRYNKM